MAIIQHNWIWSVATAKDEDLVGAKKLQRWANNEKYTHISIFRLSALEHTHSQRHTHSHTPAAAEHQHFCTLFMSSLAAVVAQLLPPGNFSVIKYLNLIKATNEQHDFRASAKGKMKWTRQQQQQHSNSYASSTGQWTFDPAFPFPGYKGWWARFLFESFAFACGSEPSWGSGEVRFGGLRLPGKKFIKNFCFDASKFFL